METQDLASGKLQKLMTWGYAIVVKRLVNQKHRLAKVVLGVGLLMLAVVLLLVDHSLAASPKYIFSRSDASFTGKADPSLMTTKNLTYDTGKRTYYLNQAGMKSTSSAMPSGAKSVGDTSATAHYSLAMPKDLYQGYTVYDNKSGLSFRVKPNFATASGKLMSGHFIYPLTVNGAELTYTIKADGLQEDVLLNKPLPQLSLSFNLKLPNYLTARQMSNGTIGIYSADPALFGHISYGSPQDQLKVAQAKLKSKKDYLVFALLPPTIYEHGNQNSNPAGSKVALKLKGQTISLSAINLSHLSYPADIDPSVIVTSAASWAASGNNEGGINVNTGITEAGLDGGVLGSWAATSSLPIASYGSTSVAYDGYVYVIGGDDSGTLSSTVDYAPLNANGALGSWTATTSLPTATDYATSVVYNGYVYEIGGYTGSATSTVAYAPINANGTLGTWTATTSLPAATYDATSVVYNGYVYEISGIATSLTATVDYAPLNADGTIGAWTATSSMPAATDDATSVLYNGYVYEIGGDTGSATATVDYAPINAKGTLGSWTATTSLPTATYNATSVVYNGYVYEIGGNTGSATATVDYAPINADGTIGAWTATTSLPAANDYATSVVYNGYVYEISGENPNPTATVDYAQIQPAGYIGSPNSTTANAWVATTSVPGDHSKGNYYYPIDATSVTYNGYIYQIGGFETTSSATATVNYAPINADGTLGSWATTTSLPAGTYSATSVVYNGYVYEIGGDNSSGGPIASVYSAPIATNGTLGAWTATTSLPTATAVATSVVYNGYVYEIGGASATAQIATVDYAPLNSNGTLGAWTATTSLPNPIEGATSITNDGYIYEIGGCNSTCPTSTVDYAPINANGTLGAWTATTSLLNATENAPSVLYNGYIYEIGGQTPSSYTTAVEYAPINTNGTIGTWAVTTSLPIGTYNATSVVYNGFVYEIGGETSAGYISNVYYANINNGGPGTLGTFTATTSLPAATYYATSVVYNGYVYEIGGNTGSATATVNYAPINADGTLGTWTSTTSLPAANYAAASVVYNGYVYEIGGLGVVRIVDYAPINANGTLGAWTATTSLPSTTASDSEDAVVYNGYVYEIGGENGGSPIASVDYAPINANGTLGAWTATTSLPTATNYASSVVYNGYVYEIGGTNGATVDYAPINANGTLGTWTATTSLPAATDWATSVVYNGYVYEIGGDTTTVVATVDYAPINANGTLGAWTATTSLPTATKKATSVIYNGYIYEIGGYTTAAVATVDYAPLNVRAHVGYFSDLIDIVGGANDSLWSSTTSLPSSIDKATSVVYNGYVYEIGGYTTAAVATVDYAPINTNGTLGTWSSTNSIPTATYQATSVVYNGYVYEIGGCATSCPTSSVDYAPINTNGTLGTWSSTSALPGSGDYQATSVVYNGYVYEIGGNTGSATATVDYAPINTNGTLGTWSSTNSLPTAMYDSSSVVYNGYVYEICGWTGTGTSTTVDYAPINANGTLGTWSSTNSPGGVMDATAVALNGYVYEIGGLGDAGTVDYAPINANGTLGAWSATTSLEADTSYATSVLYNGYLYVIGGSNDNGTTTSSTVEYWNASSVNRDITAAAIVLNGTNMGNPGIGIYDGLGGVGISYSIAGYECASFSTNSQLSSNNQDVLGTPLKISYSVNGCGTETSLGRYVWVRFTLDDSQTATFPDVNSNHTAINSLTLYYHANVGQRLRGGATFEQSSLQALDTTP